MKRTGILGGTFDPVHCGHLSMARAATEAGRLDRVLMIPTARPPHKERPGLTGSYQRFAMLALSAGGSESIALSEIELVRGGRSYMVETLAQLREERAGEELVLIVGSDSYADMGTWRSYRRILEMAAVLVVPRTRESREAYRQALPRELAGMLREEPEPPDGQLGRLLPAAWLLETEPVEVSSTEIRRRLKRRETVEGLLPGPVASYIRRQGLYA